MNAHLLAFGLLAILASGSALAQKTELAPSPAVTCMTPHHHDGLEYPFKAYKSKKPGRVKVALNFDSPTGEPQVEVLEREGEDDGADFVNAVRQHVRTLRVPCLQPGQPVRLLLAFVFQTDRRKVTWSPPEDAADDTRRSLLKCVVHLNGQNAPDYPQRARNEGMQGRVFARLRFVAPDRPPEVELLHRPRMHRLAYAVGQWLEDRRMPCHAGGSINAEVEFIFSLGSDVFGFKALDLLSVIRATEGLETQALSINTADMGCPFELKLRYLKPWAPNLVGQVGAYDPAREPLMRWLSEVTLKLPDRTLDLIYADTADVAVPCIDLQLTPKEKTS